VPTKSKFLQSLLKAKDVDAYDKLEEEYFKPLDNLPLSLPPVKDNV
jgi:hypothetical protein